MFRWYQDAKICFVYLFDLHEGHLPESLLQSRWFTRGWTLQELIASKSVYFYNNSGKPMGSKKELGSSLSKKTGIPEILLHGDGGIHLSDCSVEEKFSWAKGRETKREEDMAYCMFGLFDVHMPLIYGEGRKKAMARLRREIKEAAKNEESASDNEYAAHPEPVTSESNPPNKPSYYQTTAGSSYENDYLSQAPITKSDIATDLIIQEFVNKFVDSYYRSWAETPYLQHQFYSHDSECRYTIDPGDSGLWRGQQMISEQFQRLAPHQSGQWVIESKDFLFGKDSHFMDPSILLTIIGKLLGKTGFGGHFVQCFTLRGTFTGPMGIQFKGKSGGCITQDIFRLRTGLTSDDELRSGLDKWVTSANDDLGDHW